ncbi:glutaminyl-peptide cyclotransferase [Mariniblastus fucicola]|uniref:Glutamine cyclotransferase n=1 Tax=Mariniblastus fucicola TaxID=980251 RepID=A0A5B9P996_9BACT|nr:glutaminyl-peptide cyclotransferase [Mariniblastus fucicola]QEG21805.1 Glutamine cyclotransferase [Mariniblastus fucicola]
MPTSRTRWELVALFLVIAVGGTYLAVWMKTGDAIPEFGYKVVDKFPHDEKAYTQGLLFHDGFLYESTGLTGQSSLRKVEPETGVVLKQFDLSDELFGEGLTWFNDQFIQLTWQNDTGIVYKETDDGFEEVKRFPVDHEGWGITDDGNSLIVSDGTANLRFLDPDSFEETSRLYVRRKDRRVLGQLNELEHFGSKIYANIYNSDKIYRIDENSGDVEAIIDLSGLWPFSDRPRGNNAVLNGIAIKPGSNGTMWVTGKLCPYVYEIEIVPK